MDATDLRQRLSSELTKQDAIALISNGLSSNPMIKTMAVMFITRSSPDDLERYRKVLLTCLDSIEGGDLERLDETLNSAGIPPQMVNLLMSYVERKASN